MSKKTNLLTLSTIAPWMKAQLIGEDQSFTGISIDSRSVSEGNLFIAIKGETVDGHDFIEQAQARGAVAAVVSREVKTKLPLLKVEDSVLALGQLAKQFRNQFSLPMAAVTGSCGKTTIKEMIASILSTAGETLASTGNLNTDIGVPLTLMRLLPEHQYAVIEMGARKPGDIATLMQIASPDVTLITNAGVAHLEIFGSRQGIAKAKGEIFKGLKPSGTAVINVDDPNATYWKSLLTTQKLITFGLKNDVKTDSAEPRPDVTCAELIQTENFSTFNLITKQGTIPIKLQAPGKHNVSNALGAAAVAMALGLPLDNIAKGLANFTPVSGRLQFKRGTCGATLLDDTYNANPVSVKAALNVLANFPGEQIFVMGDMLELGPDTVELHREIGTEAKKLGIHKMFGIGSLTENATKAFGLQAKHFSDKKTLIEALHPLLNKTTTVLIKGSRGMRMEEIVKSLLASETRENNLC